MYKKYWTLNQLPKNCNNVMGSFSVKNRLTAPAAMPAHTGAKSLKKPQPHHIITLQFSEVVKDHANY